MNWRLLLLSTALASSFGSCFAQAQTNYKPKVIAVEGQPFRVEFGDASSMVLKKSVAQLPAPLSIPFSVFDTSCSDHRGQQCRYITPYRKIWYFFVWEKHKDQSKIGKPVKYKGGANFEESTDFTGNEREFVPSLAQGLSPVSIECSDYKWLPGAQTNAPQSLQVDRWDIEFMLPNPETDVSENRTSFGGLDIELSKQSPTRLQIEHIGGFSTSFGSATPILMVGDVVTMTMTSSKGDLCQAELKPAGIQAVSNNARKIDELRPDPLTETNVYIFGSDEVSKEYEAKKTVFTNNIQNFLRGLEYVNEGAFE